jgi:hypothetical protein
VTSRSWTDDEPSHRDNTNTDIGHEEVRPPGGSPGERAAVASGLNPMDEPFLTLPMTLAWVLFRTPDAVEEVWDEHREKPAELLDVMIAAAMASAAFADHHPIVPGVGSYERAERLLCKEAKTGKWRASGIPKGGGSRRQIEPWEWADFLKRPGPFVFSFGQAGDGDLPEDPRALRMDYTNVLFPTTGVLESFPGVIDPPSAPLPPGPRSKKNAVIAADRRLFPHGPPEGMSVQERRTAIIKELKRHGITPPHTRSFQRYGIGK